MDPLTRVLARALLPLLLALGAASAQDVSLRPGDEVLGRAFLPTDQNRHGQFRLIRRPPDACVAQTALSSSSLRRGLKEIRTREAYHWPPDRVEHGDSRRMLDALEAAQRELAAGASPTSPPPERLMMEFTATPTRGEVAFYDIAVDTADAAWQVTSLRLLGRVETGASYAQRCVQLQTEAALRVEGAALLDLLAAAGWPALRTVSAAEADRPVQRLP